MDACDVVIVGGGPAGAVCGWKLRQSGFDVVILDKAAFPRDKVCAGWIPPALLRDLEIDPDEYRTARTLQAIDGFRVGTIGRDTLVDVPYGTTVSFAIRRREFDEYLLRRSGARTVTPEAVTDIRRDGARWIVNDRVAAPMLVGAGGHFCPVSALLNGPRAGVPLVVAQDVELPLDNETCGVVGTRPEIYFCDDLLGYGWCFRKERYVNIGLGRMDRQGIQRAVERFVGFLTSTGRLAADASSWRWRGHAYETSASGRRTVGDGVLLAGDAAGLASPISGEGIRPAVQSGLMAASAIASAGGEYTSERLSGYAKDLRARFGARPAGARLAGVLPTTVWLPLTLRLLRTAWFARRVAIERWFLHAS